MQAESKLIEKNIKNKIEYFCWPWGHRNKSVVELLKKEGVKGFVTTKKGTNGRVPNYEMIRRVELRKFTPDKFKLNLFLTRNYILGKIYGLVSQEEIMWPYYLIFLILLIGAIIEQKSKNEKLKEKILIGEIVLLIFFFGLAEVLFDQASWDTSGRPF